MATTSDDGTVKPEDLAEFIWCAEYDADEYPWITHSDDEKAYYRDCASGSRDEVQNLSALTSHRQQNGDQT